MIVQPKLLNFQCRRVYVHVHESQNKRGSKQKLKSNEKHFRPGVACCLIRMGMCQMSFQLFGKGFVWNLDADFSTHRVLGQLK